MNFLKSDMLVTFKSGDGICSYLAILLAKILQMFVPNMNWIAAKLQISGRMQICEMIFSKKMIFFFSIFSSPTVFANFGPSSWRNLELNRPHGQMQEMGATTVNAFSWNSDMLVTFKSVCGICSYLAVALPKVLRMCVFQIWIESVRPNSRYPVACK